MSARRHRSLVHLLEWRAEQQADQLAFTFLGDREQRMMYGELDRRARIVAADLAARNLGGERVLLLYPSGLDYLTAFFGCLYAGAIAVPVYPPRANRSAERLEAIAIDSGARIALTTTATKARTQQQIDASPALAALEWRASDALDPNAAFQRKKIDENTIAFLQYTSGSTASPKGVVLTHGNLLHNERMMFDAFENRERFSCVGWLPLYHDMGLIGNVLQPIYAGAHCALMAPETFLVRPIRWLEAISRFKATTSGGPNFAYELCVDKIKPDQRAKLDLSSWEVAFNGAEPVRASTIDRFSAAFASCGFKREAFRPCYGLAEGTLLVSVGKVGTPAQIKRVDAASLAAGVAAPAIGDQPSRDLVSAGTAWHQRVRIVDPETHTVLPNGAIGEVWVSGPSVAQGYWRRPEESQRTFGATIAGGPIDEHHLRTGDLGFFQDGELFITGRRKDLIILAGRNLYPQDLERCAELADPAVRPGCSAAFAIDRGDQERLILVAEIDRRAANDASRIEAAIRKKLSADEGVAPFEVVLIRQGTIPRTSSGKIQRHKTKQEYLERTLERSDASSASLSMSE